MSRSAGRKFISGLWWWQVEELTSTRHVLWRGKEEFYLKKKKALRLESIQCFPCKYILWVTETFEFPWMNLSCSPVCLTSKCKVLVSPLSVGWQRCWSYLPEISHLNTLKVHKCKKKVRNCWECLGFSRAHVPKVTAFVALSHLSGRAQAGWGASTVGQARQPAKAFEKQLKVKPGLVSGMCNL